MCKTHLKNNIKKKFKNYTLQNYEEDVKNLGLSNIWDLICEYIIAFGETEFLSIKNFSELYEIGLATQDKQQKKNYGQYYTPDDVAKVMSQWLDKQEGEIICDVSCGTGKLIITYLDYIGKERAIDLIKNEKIYLYDLDKVALKICKISLMVKYGLEFGNCIHDFACDFLDNNVILPKNCKTIANPPYAVISNFGENWNITNVIKDTKEYYSAFMEKIVEQSKSTVIITPYSFISGNKFYSLRQVLTKYSGFIYSFDNVPGNIFRGKKHGIFNSNTSNSVRAAITVVNKNKNIGFKLTPLIRFKNIERENLLKCDILENFLGEKSQTISNENPSFAKCHKQLENIFESWTLKSENHILKELITPSAEFTISMPNTCRYYTTASAEQMKRNGQIIMHFDNEDIFNFIYCFINSSFVYWFWRMYDGGITYPTNLLMKVPSIFHLLKPEDKQFFKKIAQEMINKAEDYKITKKNVGIQENIKYPKKYRDKINERILKILDLNENASIFDIVHSNMALEVNL